MRVREPDPSAAIGGERKPVLGTRAVLSTNGRKSFVNGLGNQHGRKFSFTDEAAAESGCEIRVARCLRIRVGAERVVQTQVVVFISAAPPNGV
jgi:hypothetical protein